MDLLDMLNTASCGGLALVLIYAVMHPRVQDGIIVKVGLISMALGFGSIAVRSLDGMTEGDAANLARSVLMISSGAFVVLGGYVIRNMRHPARRLSDWLRPARPYGGMVHRDPWAGRRKE